MKRAQQPLELVFGHDNDIFPDYLRSIPFIISTSTSHILQTKVCWTVGQSCDFSGEHDGNLDAGPIHVPNSPRVKSFPNGQKMISNSHGEWHQPDSFRRKLVQSRLVCHLGAKKKGISDDLAVNTSFNHLYNMV